MLRNVDSDDDDDDDGVSNRPDLMGLGGGLLDGVISKREETGVATNVGQQLENRGMGRPTAFVKPTKPKAQMMMMLGNDSDDDDNDDDDKAGGTVGEKKGGGTNEAEADEVSPRPDPLTAVAPEGSAGSGACSSKVAQQDGFKVTTIATGSHASAPPLVEPRLGSTGDDVQPQPLVDDNTNDKDKNTLLNEALVLLKPSAATPAAAELVRSTLADAGIEVYFAVVRGGG